MDEPWQDHDVDLSLIRHAEIFQPYSGASFNRCVAENSVLVGLEADNVSYAIESQFANLPNVSDIL